MVMHLQPSDVVRFYPIRLIPDFVRYEPRNIGIVVWNVQNYQPIARVDVPTLHRVAHETRYLIQETMNFVTDIANGFELAILRELRACSDAHAADRRVEKDGLRLSAYTPYIVERPGSIFIHEKAFVLDARLETLEGCVAHLMDRMVMLKPR